MGTTTPILGLYQPDNGETGWGDEVNTNLDVLETRITGNIANVKDYGAVGDRATDDSDAIQAAIDADVGVVYFPGAYYRIHTPLQFKPGQHYIGAGAQDGFVGGYASVLELGGGNELFVDVASQILSNCVIEGLTFRCFDEDYVGTAFGGTGTPQIVSCKFVHCDFRGLEWAFDMTPTGIYLINWQIDCTSSSPSNFATPGFLNDNHWLNCTWNNVRNHVPAVELGSTSEIAGGGNWFTHCYFESISRQAIKFNGVTGGIRSTYLESINEDGTTYTAFDGSTHKLPAFDICAISQVYIGDLSGEGLAGAWDLFGNTETGADISAHLQLYNLNITAGGDGPTWDASGISVVDTDRDKYVTSRPSGSVPGGSDPIYSWAGIRGEGGDGFKWSGTGTTRTLQIDALQGDWFDIWSGEQWPDANWDVTIANPLNATRGRRITFEFARADATALASVAWGDAFALAGSFTLPSASTTRRIISFYYNGAEWIETYRSAANIPVGA